MINILIAGCAKEDNIGFMIAKELKKINSNVVITGLNIENLDNAAEKVIDRNVYCDLSDYESVSLSCESIYSTDMLLYAAGLSGLSWFEDIDVEEFMDTIYVNSISPFFLIKSLGEKLKGATVCSISSNASHIPMRCSLAYNMSKAALTMGMKQLARELTEPEGMTIFTVSPNKLKGTGMSKITDKAVQGLRGWTEDEAVERQESAILCGEETDPIQFAKFMAELLIEKENHKMMSGCDIPYGA